MANAPRPVDTENTETDEKKDDKPKRVQGPRPAYVLLSGPLPEGMEVVGSTRKAEEALQAIHTGKAEAYLRLMIK